jgi:dsDNA-binding SOS-regulon protein
MTVDIQREVERYFSDSANANAYRALLDDMLEFCEGLKHTLGSAVVRAVYSRRDKQGVESLKAFPKIGKALAAKRADNPSAPVTAVEDIIGLTIVVH